MDRAVLKNKLLKGSLAGVIRMTLAIPLYLVLTPYALSRLGSAMFGIWSFSTIMISLINLTDFGFKNSLVRFVAMNLDRKEDIHKYFNAAFWMYFVLSIVSILLTWFFSEVIVTQILRVPLKYSNEAAFVIMVSTVSFALRFLATPFQSIVEGFQDHFYSQSVSLVWLIVNSAGSMIALAVKPDIYTLGMVSIVSNVIVVMLFVDRVRRRYSVGWPCLRSTNMDAVGSLFRFGVGVQIATIVICLREPLYKVLITRTGDLDTLASFDVAYRLCTQLVSLVVSPLLGTFAVSALLCNRREELEKILKVVLGFTIAVFIPSVLFWGSFSPGLIAFWLGHRADETAFQVFLIFASFAVYYATEPLYKTIEGSGASNNSALAQVFSISISFVSYLILAPQGSIAISLSLFVGFSAFSLWNYVVFRRRFKGMVLVRPSQLLILLCPALGYSMIGFMIPADWLPVLFCIFVVVHVMTSSKSKVFDFIGMASMLTSMRSASTHTPPMEQKVVES